MDIQFDLNAVLEFLRYAFDAGYNTVSVSGGEPFLYRQLDTLLYETKKIGYKNIGVSNGMLLKKASSQNALELLDLLAISIDGPRELHNKLRNLDSAYDKMTEGVEVLKKMQKKWGFIHTVTAASWPHLAWLGEFCYSNGGSLLQLHPLEDAGRASTLAKEWYAGQVILQKAYILSCFLYAKYEGDMVIQSDFFHRDVIYTNKEIFLPRFNSGSYCLDNFIEALPILVIDEKGNILPFSYGMSSDYKIGNVNAIEDMTGLFKSYFYRSFNMLNALFSATYKEVINDNMNDIVIWTDKIVHNSYSYSSSPSPQAMS